MSSASEYDLDLIEGEERIRIKQKDGTVKTYILREISGRKRAMYMNAISSKTARDPRTGKAQGIKNFDGIETALLELCLYEEGAVTPVPKATIEEWPSRIVTHLNDRAKQLSGLDAKAEETAKKSTTEEKTDIG
jgi:hypothetical protein